MEKRNAVQGQHLEFLFEVTLEFREMSPVTSRDAGEGEYIGSGEGTVKGPKVHGIARWDLFEKEEETRCRSNLLGVIYTDDGAQIRFDSRGFFIKPDQSKPNRWITSASVHFHTQDRGYGWLNPLLAVWAGEFDMSTHRHHYQAYTSVED